MRLHHFSSSEFQCGCGCGLGFNEMQQPFLLRLDRARRLADVPFTITSSIRCPEHNTAVGGVEDSAHVAGWAVDVAAADSRQRYKVITGALEAGIQRIGVGESFVHLDTDPSKPPRVVWSYG